MNAKTKVDPANIVSSSQYADLLRVAFDQIAPKPDWKGPIDAIVPYEAANVYMDAIEFKAECKAECSGPMTFGEMEAAGVDLRYAPKVAMTRLTAKGYRLAGGQ